MKFSTILTFAIATYTATTLASAQSFQQRNADEAERLTGEFAKLTPNSPCTNNQQACVQDKFAQCVGGKFALTTCAGGLKCVVLPLVNKEGTSITCSTEEDRQKRLENARNAGKAPAKSILPDDGNPKDPKENEPPKGPKENEPPKDPKENEPPKIPKENEPPKIPKGKENDNDMPPKEPKENDGKMPPEKPKENDGKNPKENDGKKPKENDGKKPKENDGKKPKENDGKKPKENDPKNPGNDDDVPPEEPKGKEPQTPPPPPAKKPDDELAAIRRQNADDAEDLQESFKSLTPDSDCEQNQIACVNEQIAQCDNGKFALRECGQGLICTALPLVLKRGTTVTCTTAEDRDNRLNEARNNLKK